MRYRGFVGGFWAVGLTMLSALPPEAGPAPEVKANGNVVVTLYPQEFLAPGELAMLRMVQENEQALAIFLPQGAGYAALAVSPEDGFLREGHPVASAVAIAGLPDMQSAGEAALAGCNKSRKGKSPCLLVLTVEPG